MNKILFILIVCLTAQALAIYKEKEEEKEECECNDPCRGECGCKKTKSIYFTDKLRQEVNDVAWLTCTPDSYFAKIKYEGCYKLNTTCFGLVFEKVHREEGIYTGYRRDEDKEGIEIDGAPYKTTWTSSNGNLQRLEEAKLSGCQECENEHGHLYAFAQYVADDPVEGCCHEDCEKGGVKEFTAVAYKLQIYGRCCSTCYLQAATISYTRRIVNDLD